MEHSSVLFARADSRWSNDKVRSLTLTLTLTTTLIPTLTPTLTLTLIARVDSQGSMDRVTGKVRGECRVIA